MTSNYPNELGEWENMLYFGQERGMNDFLEITRKSRKPYSYKCPGPGSLSTCFSCSSGLSTSPRVLGVSAGESWLSGDHHWDMRLELIEN